LVRAYAAQCAGPSGRGGTIGRGERVRTTELEWPEPKRRKRRDKVERLAARYRVSPSDLRRRVKAGEIDLDADLPPQLERYRCRYVDRAGERCERYALGESGACKPHVWAVLKQDARAGRFVTCRVCGRRVYRSPSTNSDKPDELCRDHYLDSEDFAKAQEKAWKAKRRKHEQARERWRAEEPKLLTSRQTASMLGTSYVPAKLEPVRVEAVAGASYDLYTEPHVIDFRREWARGGDGRRRAWSQPEHVTAVLGGRDLTARAVRDAERRARERRALLARHRRGRKKRTEAPRHHLEWATQIEELRDYYERQVSAYQVEKVPGPWRLCEELAAELFPGDPNGPARIYKAITTLKALQIATN
jgi:hypothetical protein